MDEFEWNLSNQDSANRLYSSGLISAPDWCAANQKDLLLLDLRLDTAIFGDGTLPFSNFTILLG